MLDRLDTARLTASSDTANATLATAVNRAADRPMAPVSRATRIASGARARSPITAPALKSKAQAENACCLCRAPRWAAQLWPTAQSNAIHGRWGGGTQEHAYTGCQR